MEFCRSLTGISPEFRRNFTEFHRISQNFQFHRIISAILINIPGTPDAVPTMIEGHALAKKGVFEVVGKTRPTKYVKKN